MAQFGSGSYLSFRAVVTMAVVMTATSQVSAPIDRREPEPALQIDGVGLREQLQLHRSQGHTRPLHRPAEPQRHDSPLMSLPMRDDDRAADRHLQRHDSPLMSLSTRDDDRAADRHEQLWEIPPPGGVKSYMSEQLQLNMPLMMTMLQMAFSAWLAWLTFRPRPPAARDATKAAVQLQETATKAAAHVARLSRPPAAQAATKAAVQRQEAAAKTTPRREPMCSCRTWRQEPPRWQ